MASDGPARAAADRLVTVRVPESVVDALRTAANVTGRDVESVAAEMLTESAKTRAVPGIQYVDAGDGRSPVIAGTGIKVAVVVDRYLAMDQDLGRLTAAFDWLSEEQLGAALAFWRKFPEDVQAYLELDERSAIHSAWARHPETRPRPLP